MREVGNVKNDVLSFACSRKVFLVSISSNEAPIGTLNLDALELSHGEMLMFLVFLDVQGFACKPTISCVSQYFAQDR